MRNAKGIYTGFHGGIYTVALNTTKGIYTGFHRGENQNPWWVFPVVFRCENRSLNKK